MKTKQYFFIFLVVIVGASLVVLLRRVMFNEPSFKSQMVIHVTDTSYTKFFPDKMYVLNSLNFYRYFRKNFSSYMIDASYVGNVYDYKIRIFFKNLFQLGNIYFVNERFIDSAEMVVIYRSSYSVFYEKYFPFLEFKSGKIFFMEHDSIYSVVGELFLSSKSFNCKIIFKKDSLNMYNFKVL